MTQLPGDHVAATTTSEPLEPEVDAALELVAMGWATSLGGLVQAAAAFRAGVSRFQAARDFDVFEVGDEAPHGAIVSPVSGYRTFGFVGIGRLVVLAMAAIEDLRHNTVRADWPSRFHLFVAVPDPWQRAIEMNEGDNDEEAQRVQWLGEMVAHRVFANLGLPYSGCRCFGGGRDATFQAAAAAESAMASAAAEHGSVAMVLSVDSLVAPACIEALANDQKLKTSNQPIGLCPGEAAVAMFVRSVRNNRALNNSVLLTGLGFSQEGQSQDRHSTAHGMASLASLRAAIRRADAPKEIGLVIIDHTGQVADGHEWGTTLVGLGTMGLPTETMKTWYTMTGFGEVGTAFGGVAIGLAMRGMIRGYAPASVLIKAVGERGRRAGALVKRVCISSGAGSE